jgi:hypothetical protein
MMKQTAVSNHRKKHFISRVEHCMGFEEDDISAAELAAMFKNTHNSDKLDTGNVV